MSPGHRYTGALERFIFDGEDQDIDKFLSDPFWGRYSEESGSEPSPAVSFKAARPSTQPVYAAIERWRDAVISGTSLFTGEPLDYREAAAGLVNDFVKQPLLGEGSFTGKLEEQLEHSTNSAVQLAAELLFVYCLPMHQSSMGQAAKIDLTQTTATPIWLEQIIGVNAGASRAMFDAAVQKPEARIAGAIEAVLAQAGVSASRIGTVFMTGGSSSLPVVQAAVAGCLPGVRIATGDVLGSVGTGLALDALRRFA